MSLILLASLALGCTNAAKGTNANSTASSPNGKGNANAGPRSTSSQSAAIDIKEPERYSVSMTISAQAASEAPSPMATQQFGFAKLGADRRWTFMLPAPLGQTVYLEKSGLKYLVLLDRKQYVELMPEALGVQLGGMLTPGAIAERLKSRAQHEQLGLDTINGRTAIKYRLTGSGDASRQTDGMIFVDRETGLPLRCEMNLVLPAGTKSRVIVEARDLQLSPDRAQFDVPAGMKKVSPQEAKQQVEGFATALRLFADIMSGARPAALAEAARPIANKNASGRTR
ncbi:MAG: hypothetical protein AABN34_25460 [Acidobacteriota bacterium]